MARHIGEPRSRVYDSLLILSMVYHNIDVQSVFSWASKVVRKSESEHWLPCGAEGRSLGWAVGVRSRDYQILLDG